MNLKNAIFDMDGTLLDSMAIWENLFDNFLLDRNITPPKNIRETIRPLSPMQSAEYFKTEFKLLESPKEILTAMYGMVEDWYFNHVVPKKDIIDFLDRLTAGGIGMCVATSTPTYLAKRGLERNNMLKYFSKIYSTDDIKMSKDDPEFFKYVAAAENFGIADTLVFEDALFAIESAKAAGFKVVGIYEYSAIAQQNSIRKTADIYINSYRELDGRI